MLLCELLPPKSIDTYYLREIMSRPFVSVVTPTYNRRKFIPTLIAMYKAQTYPKDRMEWIILDDGQEKVDDLFAEASAKGLPNIRYLSEPDKMTIGAKRNRLNAEAKGDIIVSMDDDDYYLPERVAYTVTAFGANPKIELAGCSEIYMYYTDIGVIYKFGPYAPKHATNGTLAIRRSYAKTHKYDEHVLNAEEKSFLDEYKNPMIQLNSMKVMLVISHKDNTFSKIKFREQPENPFVKKTSLKIRDFVRDKQTRDFFTSV
jgi:glycosyltransferase involved in cell wall biosynthesis